MFGLKTKSKNETELTVIGKQEVLTVSDLSLSLYNEYEKVQVLIKKNEELEKQLVQNKTLSNDLRTQNVVISNLNSQIAAKDREISNLNSSISRLENKIEQLKSEIAQSKVIADKMQESINRLKIGCNDQSYNQALYDLITKVQEADKNTYGKNQVIEMIRTLERCVANE